MQVFKSLAVCFNEYIVIGTTKEDSRPSNKGGFFSTFFLIVFDLFFVLLFFLSSEHGEVKVKKDLDWEIAPKSVSFFFLSLYLSLIPCLRQEKHSATQKSHREERGREKRQVRKRTKQSMKRRVVKSIGYIRPIGCCALFNYIVRFFSLSLFCHSLFRSPTTLLTSMTPHHTTPTRPALYALHITQSSSAAFVVVALPPAAANAFWSTVN